ncbi:MAG TPA: response regulator [Caulobacteraceae bacterium]|nr:response regulator [Caulobacteraceae bacterium]
MSLTADAPPAARRILVVEDEMMIAMMLEDMLSDLGHSVVAIAGQLDSALGLARETDADMVILDLDLGGQTSLPVAQVLSERGIPFIFASGYGSQGLSPPFQDVITLKKPFDMNDLSRALKQMPA